MRATMSSYRTRLRDLAVVLRGRGSLGTRTGRNPLGGGSVGGAVGGVDGGDVGGDGDGPGGFGEGPGDGGLGGGGAMFTGSSNPGSAGSTTATSRSQPSFSRVIDWIATPVAFASSSGSAS
jgi:hypothetical protein